MGKKRILAGVLAIAMTATMALSGCGDSSAATDAGDGQKADYSNEEYVWVSCLSNQSMFVNSDQAGLKQFAEDYGVKVSVVGPTDYDVAGQAAALDQVVATKPAGIMVIGMESSLKDSIDAAVDAGIPVVTIDADVSDSKRLCFIGTDWYQLGVKHAEAVIEATGGKGKCAVIYQQGTETQEDALDGFKDTIAGTGMEFVDAYSANGSIETACQIAEDLMTSTPDIAAISCFDGSTPGLGTAIEEMGKTGSVIATGTNAEDTQLQQLKDGKFYALVGQKRQLFSYWGGAVLFAYNHSSAAITANDKENGILNIPQNVDTGLYLITADNVDSFLNK